MNLIFFFFVIVPSAIFHEYAHAWAAYQLGDPTAKEMGRLTLNPLAHIDPIGTILLPIFLSLYTGGRFLFAYAKPVPFNPYFLRNKKFGPALVAMAGPLANIALALVFGLIVRFLPVSSFADFLSIVVYLNILLAVFNLIPIPPLDGSRILFAILPSSLRRYGMALERMGFLFILIFIFLASPLISYLVSFIFNLITGRFFVF